VSQLIATLQWRDVLDILVVAALVYRVLMAFRGTRAMQITVGLGVLALGTVLARTLALPSLTWVLDQFWSYWVVVLIVVFQPELRRALAWVGEGPVLKRLLGDAAERAQVVDEVVRAAEALAGRRIGALIVLERPDTQERLAGSLAATAIAVVNGASLVRTHDVAETRDAVRIAERLRRGRA